MSLLCVCVCVCLCVCVGGGSSLQKDLLLLLTRGTAQEALLQALKPQGSLAEHELVRCFKSFESAATAASELLQTHVQHCCALLMLRLNALTGMATWQPVFDTLALDEQHIDAMAGTVQRLFAQSAAAVHSLPVALKRLKNLFLWLLWGAVLSLSVACVTSTMSHSVSVIGARVGVVCGCVCVCMSASIRQRGA